MEDFLPLHGFSSVLLLRDSAWYSQYSATREESGEKVELIRLKQRDADSGSLFGYECETLLQMRHPFLKEYETSFEIEKEQFILTKETNGRRLGSLLQEKNGLSQTSKNKIIIALSFAFMNLEANQVFHFHLSPDAVEVNEENLPVLNFYGLLPISTNNCMPNATDYCTYPNYIPCGIVAGDFLDSHCDLSSFACLIFLLMTGEELLPEDIKIDNFSLSVQKKIQQMREESMIPTEWITVLERCLQREAKPFSFSELCKIFCNQKLYFPGVEIPEIEQFLEQMNTIGVNQLERHAKIVSFDAELQEKFIKHYEDRKNWESIMAQRRENVLNLLNENPEKWHDSLLMGCASGDCELMFLYALLLWNGVSVSKNRDLSIYYFVQAIKNKNLKDHRAILEEMSKDDVEAEFLLGFYFLKKGEIKLSNEKMKHSSENGSANAAFFYYLTEERLLKDQNVLIPEKIKYSLENFQKCGFASYFLGTVFDYGHYGFERDMNAAIAYYSYSASKYHIKGMTRYAELISTTDPEKCKQLMQFASKHYNTRATIFLLKDEQEEIKYQQLMKLAFGKDSKRAFIELAFYLRESHKILKNNYLFRMILLANFRYIGSDGWFYYGRELYLGRIPGYQIRQFDAVNAFRKCFEHRDPKRYFSSNEPFLFFEKRKEITVFQFFSALCQLYGNGTIQVEQGMIEIIQYCAEQSLKGDELANVAAHHLSNMYEEGDFVQINPKKAHELRTSLSRIGNIQATFERAVDLHEGINCKQNITKAKELFLMLLNFGVNESKGRLAYMEDYAKAAREHPYLQELAESGSIEALLMWAKIVFIDNSPCLPKEVAEGARIIELLQSHLDCKKCAKILASILSSNRTGQHDLSSALRIFIMLSNQGCYDSSFKAAEMVRNGRGCSCDPQLAFRLYKKAAINGSVAAELGLARCYIEQQGVIGEVKKGLQLVEKHNNNPLAHYIHGFALFHGIGMMKDEKTALEEMIPLDPYAKRSVEAESFYAIQELYNCPNITPRENVHFTSLLKNGARAYIPLAEYHAGLCYLHGIFGIDGHIVLDRAIECIESSAHSYPQARVKLAWFYYEGYGVEQNFDTAFRLVYPLTTDYPSAMILLGRMYFIGEGIGKDLEKATSLFSKALELGNSTAAVYLGYMKMDTHSDEAMKYFQIAETDDDPDGVFMVAYCKALALCGISADQQRMDLSVFVDCARRKIQNGRLFEFAPELGPSFAVRYFQSLSEQGHPQGRWCYKTCLKHGNGCLTDVEKAHQIKQQIAQ